MNIIHTLAPERTLVGVKTSSKKRLLERISGLLAEACEGVSEQEVFESLFSRERLGCTDLGNGIALPHGRCANCDHIVGALVLTEQPIDYESKDGKPVDIFFALLGPEASHEAHLECLSSIAKLLKNPSFIRQLRNAHNNQALYDIVAASVEKQIVNG